MRAPECAAADQRRCLKIAAVFSHPRGPASRAPAISDRSETSSRLPAIQVASSEECGEELSARGRVESGGDGPPIADHSKRNAPTLVALHEPTRPVDRIDDEDGIAFEASEIVGGFLRQPPIVRTRGQAMSCEASASTAISASVTSEPPDFAQELGLLRKKLMATAPAVSAALTRRSKSASSDGTMEPS